MKSDLIKDIRELDYTPSSSRRSKERRGLSRRQRRRVLSAVHRPRDIFISARVRDFFLSAAFLPRPRRRTDRPTGRRHGRSFVPASSTTDSAFWLSLVRSRSLSLSLSLTRVHPRAFLVQYGIACCHRRRTSLVSVEYRWRTSTERTLE